MSGEKKAFGIGCMNKAQSGTTTNRPSLNGAGRLKRKKEVKPIYITEEQFRRLLLVSRFAPSGPAEYDRQMRRGGEKGEQRSAEVSRGKERREE